MSEGLKAVRGRCAYWEKRIALEPKLPRREELARMAWAEIVRLAIRHGTMAHGLIQQQFAALIQQQFAVALRQHASRPKKRARRPVRAVARGS